MFRYCQIIIRELCSMLKLCYSIHNSIRICKRGVVAACCVGMCCGAVATWPLLHNTAPDDRCINVRNMLSIEEMK